MVMCAYIILGPGVAASGSFGLGRSIARCTRATPLEPAGLDCMQVLLYL